MLELAGREGRNGISLLFLFDNGVDDEVGGLYGLKNVVGLCLALYVGCLPFDFYEVSVELWRLLTFKLCNNRPVLLRDESLNFALTVDNHAQRDCLHTPR